MFRKDCAHHRLIQENRQGLVKAFLLQTEQIWRSLTLHQKKHLDAWSNELENSIVHRTRSLPIITAV